MIDPGPALDPDPRRCVHCGERYKACLVLWSMNLKCCRNCNHPRSVKS